MACSSSMGGPEHCVLHRLVAADLFRAAAGENHALVHDHDPVGVLEDDVHVVLDDHGGDPVRPDDRAYHVHNRRLLAGADAAGRPAEEQELRLERVGGGRRVISSQRTPMRPLSGWSSPLIRFTRLVLPAPLEPISATTSPSPMTKSTLSTACVSPKYLVSFSVTR